MEQPLKTFKSRVLLVLKGLAMGAANKVPGVSGGVVAFVAGFYEEFIYSLQRFNKNAFKFLFTGRFKSFFNYVNGTFLSLLFLGMIISYFSISKLLDYLIKNYELYVWSVFFGMIIGSIIYISKDFKDWKKTTITSLIIGIILGLSITFLRPATENDNLWFVFLCGIISVSGMTLPGFSGSFILILLGNYVLLLVDSVNALYDTFIEVLTGDFSFLNNLERLRMLKVLIVFTLGSITGLVTFSHLLNYILKHYKSITIASIIGFITGSLGVVWPFKTILYKTDRYNTLILDSKNQPTIENYQRFIPELNQESLISVFYIILGIGIVLVLGYYDKKNNHMRKFGLIGKNISYSFSESFFTKKFKIENILNSSYQNFDLAKIEDFKTVTKDSTIKGYNVTIPYKETIIPLLDGLNSKAAQIGAVNTIKITKHGKLKGFNTDYYGFEKSLKPLLESHHKKALILGTGGASKAVSYALERLKIPYILVSRIAKNNIIGYEDITREVLSKYHIIINCTPLGTFPNTESCPNIPYGSINTQHLFYDLIYNPSETEFLKRGKKQGAKTKNGLEMLELQAEKSWKIWNK